MCGRGGCEVLADIVGKQTVKVARLLIFENGD